MTPDILGPGHLRLGRKIRAGRDDTVELHGTECLVSFPSSVLQDAAERISALERSVGNMQEFMSRKFRYVESKLDRILEINGSESSLKEPQSPIYFTAMDKKMDRIAAAVGLANTGLETSGDDVEDRKRLKERLKEAIEKDKASQSREIYKQKEKWAEYVFGICDPDKRVGKNGSR